MKITTVSEMRAMDRRAVEAYGIPELILMENAGQAAFGALAETFGVAGKSFLVFCGSGNNGGDGFVVARKIHSNGGRAVVLLVGKREKIGGISRTNLEILERIGVEIREGVSAAPLRDDLGVCDAVVDAILGTGLSSEVRGHYREIIETINAGGRPVLSLDIPSGVHGDTGRILGAAVQADLTVTFGLPKLGNLLYPGAANNGRLYVTHISFPPAMTDAAHLKTAVSPPLPLPPRKSDGHKGDFGDALFVAGAENYYGAPFLAAMSFLKAGGGYSRLAAPRSIAPFIAVNGSEIVFVPQRQTPSGGIALDNRDELAKLAEKTDVVVVGPGLSLDPETRELVRRLAGDIQKPLVIDGDGLTAVCDDLDTVRERSAPTVLTPHLGEMARITGNGIQRIQNDAVGVLRETAADLDAVVVLKGAHSLIGLPDGRVFVNVSGNSGMASAGSGDVLTGTIAAMVGLGLPVEAAAVKGVFLHGFAGDLAADDVGPDGVTARTVMDYLPLAMKMDRLGLQGKWETRYRGAEVV